MLQVLFINSLLVAAAVLIHYGILFQLSRFISTLSIIKPHYRIVIGVFGLLGAHVIEVWLFAFGYFFMINVGDFGTLEGNFANTLQDCAYFSLTTYTSLGFGDIEPVGQLRFLAGIEALTGLVLITWTASFLFIEMQRTWDIG